MEKQRQRRVDQNDSTAQRLAALRAAIRVRQVPCRCHPGTEATGWHEVRGAACVAEEHRQWQATVDLFYADPLIVSLRQMAKGEGTIVRPKPSE